MPNKYSIVVEDDALLTDVVLLIGTIKNRANMSGRCVFIWNDRILFRVNKNKTNYSIYAYRIRREQDAQEKKV